VADLSCTYTYTTPGGTITFNNGDLGDGTDKFWIQKITGLDGALVRAPIDNVPFGDGSLIHTFRKAGRRPLLEGVLIVESVQPWGPDCQEALNAMEADFRTAVNSNIAASGTLAWTPAGQGAQSLTVYHLGEPPLDFPPEANYALRSFILSLVSPAADPS
jgi:hypothetical protein